MRTDVEATAGKNTRHAREHTGLVLDETVEQVALEGLLAGRRGVVQNVRDRLLGRRCAGRLLREVDQVRWALRRVVQLVCGLVMYRDGGERSEQQQTRRGRAQQRVIM